MDLSAEIPTQRVLSLLAPPTPSCLPYYVSGALSLSQGRDPTSMMQPPTRLKQTSTSSHKPTTASLYPPEEEPPPCL